MRKLICKGRALCFFALVQAFTSTSASAQVNSWLKPASGNWDDATSWSLGVLPSSSQSVMITNSGWKAVAINSSTPVNFPDSMTVSNLTIRGDTNTENVLLLNYFGTDAPLRILNGLTLQDDGQIVNFNSGLAVESGTFLVTNTTMIQDGGFVSTMNTEMYLANSVYNLTNGDFEGGSVSLGYPVSARFNQYGGTVTITNLSLASYSYAGLGNGYWLYGGTLNLPGGMLLLGESGGLSYIQEGGTNQTTQVTVEPDYGGFIGAITLDGGLLADSGVRLLAGYRTPVNIEQNGGSHVVTNTLFIAGSAPNGFSVDPATYYLNGGNLSAGVLELAADDGDSVFVQSNGTASAGTVYAHSQGYYLSHNTFITLAGGTLSCSNFTVDDGRDTFNQSGGALVVSNLLDFGGSRYIGGPDTYYGLYNFTGGTVTASNINITDWSIGDSSVPNRISNPGFISLSYLLQIGNATEQLGHFILATNATIDLAGSASRLSFANSSAEIWAGGSTLVIADWNGSPTGGGAEQLKFGTDQTGLTSAQLSQIQFNIASNTYSAKILNTGEVVPNQLTTNSSGLVNSWINPASGNWDQATNWSLGVLPDSAQSVMITNAGWKAVAINPSTPIDFPASMTVSNLTIRGATNTENVLLLNSFGTTVPLTVLNGLTNADDGQIQNFNSGLLVQAGTIVVTNSQMIQSGGFVIATNAPMYLQDGAYNLTNGDFEGGQVFLGFPVSARFNQYGGTAVFSDLEFGRNAAGAGGHYALYGGELSLPNGLTMRGDNNSISSYFQAGGTNRTTSVYLEPSLFGLSPEFTLNGGLLADSNVDVIGDNFGFPGLTFTQNGGTHTVENTLHIAGGAANGQEILPSTYQMSGGTLSAGSLNLDATQGDAVFTQTNGIVQAGAIQAHSNGSQTFYFSRVELSGGLLSCSNLSSVDGGKIDQSAGMLMVSNLLSFSGYQQPGPTIYTRYTFISGTLVASNINVGGDWFIGDSNTNRISNLGTCSLSQRLVISNATEQLGHFILASNATIDLAGSASRLSFANSSGQSWAGGATLVIADWNGNPSGGGAEQLKFGTDQSGLTPAQLNQLQFSLGTNLYSARILATGEVVPNQAAQPTIAFSQQGNNLVLSWPQGWVLQTATNAAGPYTTISGATSPYTNNMSLEPQRFFRLAP